MKVIIKKPELLSAEYLINNGKLNDVDVWLDMYGYVTEDVNSGETVPFGGIVYYADDNAGYNKGIESYYICDEAGFPVVSVAYYSDGTLEMYEKKVLNNNTKEMLEYEIYSYKHNESCNEIARYEKKFDDGITRRFCFDKNKVIKLSINFDKPRQSSDFEFFDCDTLLRQDYYINKETRRNIFWNKDGTIEYDYVKFKNYCESFSFNDCKYELNVTLKSTDKAIEKIKEIRNGKVIHSVYEYESSSGCIMSEMTYLENENKYHGIIRDIEGFMLLETEYNEITGNRNFREYNRDGSIISEFTLEKINNKTNILNNYEFIFE